MMKIVAFIPARAGSKRIINKNIKELCGKPLIEYTINVAIEAKIFSEIIVSTNSKQILNAVLDKYKNITVSMRPDMISEDDSIDLDWVKLAINDIEDDSIDTFAILRPTNPFRSPESIRDAWERYKLYKPESLRSIERCKQHPYKMWIKKEDHILPLSSMMTLPEKCNYYEMPTQILPEIYVQNAALEIAKMSNIAKYDNVSGSGQGIIYYEFPGREGFDINDMDDWHIAENIMGGNLP